MPWFIWIVFSFVWLLGYEIFALATKRTTLSRMAWDATISWPFTPVLVAYFVGAITWALFVHFWWHWCPELVTRGF